MGELAAIGCAVLWAASIIAMRSQTARIPVFALNATRATFAAMVFWIILAAVGRLGEIVTVPATAMFFLTGSVLIGMAAGDSLNIKSMHAIGVSRSLPISSSYPLLTAVLAVFFLGEPLSFKVIAGIILVTLGIYLVAIPRIGRVRETLVTSDSLSVSKVTRMGVISALLASVCWAMSTVLVRPALDVVDPSVANAVRLPFACVVLWGLSASMERKTALVGFNRRTLLILAFGGTLSAISGSLWLYSVLHAGAAKSATLSSTAPIFAVPLSMIFLGERPNRQVILGTVVSVIGIWLVL